MTVTLCILSFFAGIGITLWIFQEEIFHGRKVGYGKDDIHPDYGHGCCRHVPSAQHKPPIVPKKQ